jgi:hypothetical protein
MGRRLKKFPLLRPWGTKDFEKTEQKEKEEN